MSVRSDRIDAFLAWCVNKVKETVKPTPKGALSKIYVNEQKLGYKPYYFSIYASDDMLTDHIKKSNSFDVQARLMCLLSLPVDQDYFKVLSQFATIKLDEFRRIIVYKHGETVIKCEHRKFRADKFKNLRETTEHQENGSVGASSNHGSDGTSTTSQAFHEAKTQPSMVNEPVDVAPVPPNRVFNNYQQSTSTPGSSQSAHYLSAHYDPQFDQYQNDGTTFNVLLPHNVKQEQHESSYRSSRTNETSQLGMRNNTIEEEEQQFSRPLENLETPRVSNPRFSEISDSTSSIVHTQRHQSKSSTGEPMLVEVLQKLEYYFLYKCKPELMPLCLRIKEVKANEATFSPNIVSPSTIKSFFEVALRLMVATNIQEPIKVEQEEVQVQPLLLRDFFEDLKKQNLVEGLDIVIDSIQTRVGSQETISFSTISRVFLELINNLALVC
ncbi:hypothetical protein CAEBREN_10333 [Caenorhabditis brenneri]|uniref:SPK domain-containing protein n=1 Tax=Caenorhabditis brenneri TaxID=135651 RepID=G0N469_CAEBE|nr:hypothetical protein CAEBREN_10333 [Caenorhabditis brenneri]